MDLLIKNNREWAARMRAQDADFFERLLSKQSPDYFWIGCADSRVPAEQILDLPPGSLFVHRNVANVVTHADLNCLSALQFAVDVLQVKHVILCGHYGCGGVKAALSGIRLGLANNWLRNVQDVIEKHRSLLDAMPGETSRWDRLCELNVIEQALSVCRTTVVQDAWARSQELSVHGWIYGLHDGLMRDLNFSAARSEAVEAAHRDALQYLFKT